VIVKAAPTTTEALFYQQIAPILQAQGVTTPHLLWADLTAPTTWFVLEAIPLPLPPERWQADLAVLTQLKQLHQATVPSLPFSPFVPSWTDDLTQAAAAQWPRTQRAQAQRKLAAFQARSQHLFANQCWISGDPNPLNWGLRANGTVVLYDWERFGRGTPALDLAITVPGLGEHHLFEQVAQQYLSAQPTEHSDTTLELLVRDIAHAKVWNVVEFVAMISRGDVTPTDRIQALIDKLPQWLEAITIVNSR
jgi:aminoglycoside phosphotransferase (APT) family kinase protein